MDSLKLEIKQLLIEALDLEDLSPADIDDDAPLFDTDGIGLDSIDVLEIVLEMQRTFGVEITDEHVGKRVLRSVNTIVEFIDESRRAAG